MKWFLTCKAYYYKEARKVKDIVLNYTYCVVIVIVTGVAWECLMWDGKYSPGRVYNLFWGDSFGGVVSFGGPDAELSCYLCK